MIKNTPTIKQLDLFTDYKVVEKKKQQETVAPEKKNVKNKKPCFKSEKSLEKIQS